MVSKLGFVSLVAWFQISLLIPSFWFSVPPCIHFDRRLFSLRASKVGRMTFCQSLWYWVFVYIVVSLTLSLWIPHQEFAPSRHRPWSGLSSIGHIRYINILTWLRGFRVKLLYLVVFSLYSSLFWELREKRNLKNLQFWPESLGAMLEYWYIECGLLIRYDAKWPWLQSAILWYWLCFAWWPFQFFYSVFREVPFATNWFVVSKGVFPSLFLNEHVSGHGPHIQVLGLSISIHSEAVCLVVAISKEFDVSCSIVFNRPWKNV